MELNKQISILIAPSATIDEKNLAFIQVWKTMVNWNKYSALIVVDLENVYFLLFDLITEKIKNCYLGYLKNDLWQIETDKKTTWKKINNIIKLIKTTKFFEIDGRWY